MKCVVTGGAGFIGRHLVERLRLLGSVTVIDSGWVGRLEEVPSDVKLVVLDIAEPAVDQWVEIFNGVDCVFHLAAQKHHTPGYSTDQLLETNVLATWHLVQAAGLAGVRKLVFASSLYAYGPAEGRRLAEADCPKPDTLYGASKLMGESILRTARSVYGLDSVALRLFFVYGPGQFADGGYKSVIVSNFERMARGESPTIMGDGQQALDYVYVSDAVDALIAASESAPKDDVFNIASGTAVTIEELTVLMKEVARFDGDAVHLPADATAGTIRFGNPNLANQRLGWRPRVDLKAGLLQTWNALHR